MILSLYFFLVDGPAMVYAAMRLMPLDVRYEHQLLDEFDRVSRAVVLGTLSASAAQGLLAFPAFLLAGLPSVFLLTVMTMLLSLVPVVGAAAVWGGAAAWLYFYDDRLAAAIALIVWGTTVATVADYVVKPYVLHGHSNLHPLLALLSVLGGVETLGPIGIFVGPMVVAFLQALLNILRTEIEAMEPRPDSAPVRAENAMTDPEPHPPEAACAAGPSPPPRSRTGRVIRAVGRALRIALLVYLGILLLMMFFENSLLFFPSKYPEGDWNPRGMTVEDANFASADGTKLHGWFVENAHPRAVILFSHGNGGNLSHRQDIVQTLSQRLGASVLIYDYRGYGRSEGSPTEAGVLQDGRAARHWLAARAKIPESQIVLMGESLGGAVAVDLARNSARGLILDSTFSSLADVAEYHYPWAPVRMLLRSEFDNVRSIAEYHGPLLMIHGDHDRIVPMRFGERLFAAAHEPKRLVILPGVDHNDFRPPAAIRAIDQFLGDLPPVRGAETGERLN